MRQAPVGIVGTFAANRPYLSVGVLISGLAAMAVIAARQVGAGVLISGFATNAALMLALPMALASFTPRRSVQRLIYFVLVLAVFAALIVIAMGIVPVDVQMPPVQNLVVGLALFSFLSALAPLSSNVSRLGLLAPFGAVVGATGASGYLALNNLLMSDVGAMAAGIGLSIGIGTGINVAADFAAIFATGEKRKHAAAAAGHRAIAPSAFSLIAIASFMAIYSYTDNFGAIDPAVVWAGVTVGSGAMITALVAVTGGLSLSPIGEQAALDENRRRQWFSARWRPVRLALPASTAAATVAIAGIFLVIALFENGVDAPVRLAAFIALIWIGAGLTFVSIRTSLLIAFLLLVSAIIADYALSIVGLTKIAFNEKLAALTLTAVALGHMTVSWRDASEQCHNARDIVENALSDGLRRFLFIAGTGAVSLYIAERSFAWHGAHSTIIYFLSTSLIALIIAPSAMTAMSARFGR